MKKLLFIITVVLFVSCSTSREELASQKTKALQFHFVNEEWNQAEQVAEILLLEYVEYIDTTSVKKLYELVQVEKHLKQAKEYFAVKQYKEAENAYAIAVSIRPKYKPAVKWYNEVGLNKLSL